MITDEQAKAAQEVAKATKESVSLFRDAFEFFANLAQGPCEQVSGMLEDELKFRRTKRLLRLQKRTAEYMAEIGMSEPTRAVPLNFMVPVLEAGSLEEDDSLQDMWARLLVNAADADSGSEPRHAYISMLKDMTSLDAVILMKLSTAKYTNKDDTCLAAYLPNKLVLHEEGKEIPETPGNIDIALRNLERLGCVMDDAFWKGGTTSIRFVKITNMGKAIVKACTLRTEQDIQEEE